MSIKRRLVAESLESRQLLAANCVDVTGSVSAGAEIATQVDISPSVLRGEGIVGERERIFEEVRFDDPHFYPSYPFIPALVGSDFVQQHDDRLYVIDAAGSYRHESQLFVFEKTPDGVWEEFANVEVGINAERLFVSGDQVVLIGREFGPNYQNLPAEPAGFFRARTTVVTVDLGTDVVTVPSQSSTATDSDAVGPQVTRQYFEGHLVDVQQAGDRLLLTTQEDFVVIAIYPPPPIQSTVRSLQITPDGLVEKASINADLGQSVYASGTLLTGTTVGPQYTDWTNGVIEGIIPPDVTHRSVLTQHAVGESTIERVISLDLGEGHLTNLHISEDGRTAIAVRSLYTGNRQAMYVDLLDLSQAEVRVFETITIEEAYGGVLSIDDDHVLISSYHNESSLILVDTNQSIDVTAENRLRSLAVPSDLQVQYGAARVSGGKLLFVAHRYLPSDPGPRDGSAPLGERPFDIPVPFGVETVLVSISLSDAELKTQSLGVATIWGGSKQLIVIDTDSDRIGFLASDIGANGTVTVHFEFGHLDDAGDFLSDGLIADADHWLEIDANAERLIAREHNRLLRYDWDNIASPTIIELNEGHDDPIQAMDDFFTLSRSGEDHFLDVLANDDFGDDDIYYLDRPHGRIGIPEFAPPARIIELINAPQGVEIVGQQVRVLADAIANVDSLQFQYMISDGVETSTASVLVTVHAAEQTMLAEMSLRIVDEDGDAIENLSAGDEFWIEFVAQDLRRDGRGVYAAFLNLELPEELVRIVGPIEYGDGFTSISIGSFSESQLINLGAIGGVTDQPGNDGPQSIFRIQALALAAGQAVLSPTAGDIFGTETLLHGRDTVVPESRVRFNRTELVIAEAPQPRTHLDSNGDGTVNASDALKVINFLGIHGVMALDSLNAAGESEQMSDDELASMRRNDTNRDGRITPLDALVVINALQRQSVFNSTTPASGEDIAVIASSSQSFAIGSTMLDDDDEEAYVPVYTVF